MIALGLLLIFATWGIAWLISIPVGRRTNYSFVALVLVLCVGGSGSIAAVCIQ